MVRKRILAIVILAMAAVPVPALAWDGHGGRYEFRGGHERFGRHERFERFGRFHRPFVGFGLSPYPYYAAPYHGYAPPVCSLRPGYFVNQPFVDRWGHYTYRQQWVPSQRVC
jgi:hypothetical protein